MKLSVIIPVYNMTRYLRECLDSILAQTFTDWEAICVDDGSPDDCGKILDEYAAKDARIKVIHQKNCGTGEARNAGLAVATGDWIVFLDGDDVLAPSALSRLAAISAANPQEPAIRFGFEEFPDNEAWHPKSGERPVVRKDISRSVEMDDFYVYMWQFAYRRPCLDGLTFKNYKRGQDRVFVDDVILNRVDSFVATDEAFYGYRQRTSSVTHVTPSARILKAEIQHRRDIVLMIEASKKSVAYSRNRWLTKYFLRSVGDHVLRLSKSDRRDVLATWLGCVREMRHAKGLSRWTRFVYAFYLAFPFLVLPWFRCCHLFRQSRRLLSR